MTGTARNNRQKDRARWPPRHRAKQAGNRAGLGQRYSRAESGPIRLFKCALTCHKSGRALLDNDWIMIDGRPYFVAGYTASGAAYGIYLDEMDDDCLTGMITPDRPDKLFDLDLFGP